MEQHTASLASYCRVFGTLLVLTATTVGVSFVDLGPLNVAVALSIAVVKAMMVLAFFMHLNHSSRLTWVVIAGSVYWLGIMLVLTFSDYGTRAWLR